MGTNVGDKLKKLLVLSVAAFLLSACAYKHQPIYNVVAHPIPEAAQSLNLADLEKNIILAGEGRGWRFTKLEPGKLRAVQDQEKFAAEVDVIFDQRSYSIQHVSSRGMREKGDTVHAHYNFWIRNLESDIATRLNNAAIR